MDTQRKIKKVYKKTSLSQQEPDYIYWQSLPVIERLAVLEQLRMEYHAWKYGSEPRFQRVLSIIKR
jgi:hypothetical protein